MYRRWIYPTFDATVPTSVPPSNSNQAWRNWRPWATGSLKSVSCPAGINYAPSTVTLSSSIKELKASLGCESLSLLHVSCDWKHASINRPKLWLVRLVSACRTSILFGGSEGLAQITVIKHLDLSLTVSLTIGASDFAVGAFLQQAVFRIWQIPIYSLESSLSRKRNVMRLIGNCWHYLTPLSIWPCDQWSLFYPFRRSQTFNPCIAC